MSEVFISYARSTEPEAKLIDEALCALGYEVWRDDKLPSHRVFAEVLDERLTAAKAVLVMWSADAVKSDWVQSEADRGRRDRKLVQLTLDGARLPMPFDRIHCADLAGWTGDLDAPGWRKVVASVAELMGGPAPPPPAPQSGPPGALASKPSLAVMPFANLSNDPDQAYFSDGMMREIAAALTRFRSLFVIAPGSTLALKGRATSPREVARQFNVRYVLEGAVRKDGDHVRISVSLIDGDDGSQAWADHFDDTLEDVLNLQDRVARAVAGKITPEIMRAEVKRVAARPPAHPAAYDLYLRASPGFQSFRREGLLQALQLLDSAIALDPGFGPALWSAANVRAWLVSSGWSQDPEADRRVGLELAERAVQAATDNAFGLAMVCNALTMFNETRRAEVLIAQAIRINPGDAMVWTMSGHLRRLLGDLDVAMEHYETALRLAPFDRWPDTGILMCRFAQRRFGEALELLRRTHTPVPHFAAVAASLYGHLGMATEARQALANYHAASALPFEEVAQTRFHNPEHRALFLDGIARAEALAT